MMPYRKEKMLCHLSHKSHGFSLVELMVALVIGLIITLAAFQLFLVGKRNFDQAESLMARQESLRYLVDSISYDIRSASSIKISSDDAKLSLLHKDKPDNSVCNGSSEYVLDYYESDGSIYVDRYCNSSDPGVSESIVFGFGSIAFGYIQPSNIGVKVEITMQDAEDRLKDEAYEITVASRGNIGRRIGESYGYSSPEPEEESGE